MHRYTSTPIPVVAVVVQCISVVCKEIIPVFMIRLLIMVVKTVN